MTHEHEHEHVSVIVPGSGRILFFPCLVDFSRADPQPEDLVLLPIIAWQVFPCGALPPQPIVASYAGLGDFCIETADGRWHDGGEEIYPDLDAAKAALLARIRESIAQTRQDLAASAPIRLATAMGNLVPMEVA
jgi:hypothetical protein